MIESILRFRECEHDGDLDAYAQDVVCCGGRIMGRELNSMAETGVLYVAFRSVADREAFYKKFRETDSFDFCS